MRKRIRRLVMKAGLLFVVLPLCMIPHAQAASFDCAKASTKIEKLICTDAALSKLDEELAVAYKAALQDENRAESIRQTQKQWMKERNTCTDADCVKRAYAARLHALSLAPEKSVSKPKQKPRFTVTQGKGWTVCENYVKFLNTLPESEPLPLCHLKLSPDFPDLKEPDWEELDIPGHLELVYALEKLTSPSDHDRPVDNFNHWKTVFEQQVNTGEASPRLRRVQLALIDGGPVETILAYEPDHDSCYKWSRAIKTTGYGTVDANRTSLFLWDEQGQKILEYRSHTTFFGPQELLLFQGKPFTFTFWLTLSYDSSVSGYIQVNHLKKYSGGVEPYANLRRCQIGIELTPETFNRMIK